MFTNFAYHSHLLNKMNKYIIETRQDKINSHTFTPHKQQFQIYKVCTFKTFVLAGTYDMNLAIVLMTWCE